VQVSKEFVGELSCKKFRVTLNEIEPNEASALHSDLVNIEVTIEIESEWSCMPGGYTALAIINNWHLYKTKNYKIKNNEDKYVNVFNLVKKDIDYEYSIDQKAKDKFYTKSSTEVLAERFEKMENDIAEIKRFYNSFDPDEFAKELNEKMAKKFKAKGTWF
jgi:ABC-type molybdate transport system substrate-binding protein